jgi:hypothetical protein
MQGGGSKEEERRRRRIRKTHSFHQISKIIASTQITYFVDYNERLLVTISFRRTLLSYVFIAPIRDSILPSRRQQSYHLKTCSSSLEVLDLNFKSQASLRFSILGQVSRCWNIRPHQTRLLLVSNLEVLSSVKGERKPTQPRPRGLTPEASVSMVAWVERAGLLSY